MANSRRRPSGIQPKLSPAMRSSHRNSIHRFPTRHVIAATATILSSLFFVSPILVSADTNETTAGGAYTVAMSAISGGGNHTCALLGNGTVECWGRNDQGQLGDGTTTTHQVATPVIGLTGVTAISAGGSHTCALLASGSVKCWGSNFYGAVGNGGASATSPAQVTGLTSGVLAISAGITHSCALLNTGGVKCWGSDDKGQLGYSANFTNQTTPISVDGLSSGVIAISAGDKRTCAILTGGSLKCWGDNTNGGVGDNTLTQRDVPTDVQGLSSGVTAISVGTDLTCAVMSTGGVKCWGRNLTGQLGNGTTTHPTTTPTDVSGISTAVSVSTGGDNSCALLSSGEITCWGNNTIGQVGDGTTTRRTTPVLVSSIGTNGSAVTTGGDHTCTILSDHTVKCWGFNYFGQLGDNSTTSNSSPSSVSGLSGQVGVTTTTSTTTTTVPIATPTSTFDENKTSNSSSNSLASTGTNGQLPSTGRNPRGLANLASSLILIGGFLLCRRRFVQASRL